MDWIYIILCALGALLVIYLIACIFALKYAVIRRKKKKFKPKNIDEQIFIDNRNKNTEYFYSLNPQKTFIKTPDNFNLFAWFLPAETETKRFIVFSHGYRCSGGEDFNCFVPFYHNDLKYNMLFPDHRGHGRSDGDYICFGAHAHKDILLWIDYLVKNFGEDIEIILHGISMGAATVLLTNEANPPKQVKIIIEDCGYTCAYEEMCSALKGMIGFNFPAIVKTSSLLCKIRAGYYFSEADPLKNMSKAKNPILFIHGENDTFVPTYMGQKLYEACTVPKELFLVPGASHACSYFTDKEGYEQHVKDFILKHMGTL